MNEWQPLNTMPLNKNVLFALRWKGEDDEPKEWFCDVGHITYEDGLIETGSTCYAPEEFDILWMSLPELPK